MKITDIRVHTLSHNLPRAYWMSLEPYRTASGLIIEVTTDEDLVGVGQAHGRPLGQIAEIIAYALRPVLLGRDPTAVQAIWSELFAYCHSRKGAGLGESHGQPHFGMGARPQIMAGIAGIDIALWDLKAKAAGLPMYRLLGGENPAVPAYASGGYYGPDGEADVAGLVEEMTSYVASGFRAVKMKVGGLMVAADVERVSAVREAVGDDIDIMLDANTGYDTVAAIEAARAFEPLRPRWLEEPVHWYDSVFGARQVAEATHIPIASGESELHRWGCRDLILHGGVKVMQVDATRAGGVTEWLRIAGYAASHGVLMAPHHDPHLHGQLVAAVPNGLILEAFPNRARDPLWNDLFGGAHSLRHGIYTLTDTPGFGIALDPEMLSRYRVRTVP